LPAGGDAATNLPGQPIAQIFNDLNLLLNRHGMAIASPWSS